MKIDELISIQREWESSRGIDNGRGNIERIQAEVDEARHEIDDLSLLEELVDVLIILSGGVADVLDRLDKPSSFFIDLLQKKLVTNSVKYPLSYFNGNSIEAQQRAKHWWNLGMYPEEVEGNDVY